jgi:iron(II)-dependent oxidoreductase
MATLELSRDRGKAKRQLGIPIKKNFSWIMHAYRKDTIDELIRICSRWKHEFFKNETPQKEINVDSFYISKYEITNTQYKKFLDDNPSHEEPDFWYNENFNKPDQPVVGVSWHDAVAYCNWLTEKTKETYRLPTEAEWEKAARGTDERFFPWGNEWPNRNLANFIYEHKKTVPVKEKPLGASELGLMHMAGNVAEWCGDWYDENYYENPMNRKNPKGPQKGEKKVVRGGDWRDNAFYLRCNARVSYPPDTRNRFLGFRIVLEDQGMNKR